MPVAAGLVAHGGSRVRADAGEHVPYLSGGLGGPLRQENIRAGYRTEQDAIQKSREDHLRLLLNGLAVPNHVMLVIRDRATGTEIGTLWFKVVEGERRVALICDLYRQEE